MRGFVVLAMFAGCNQAFDLSPTQPRPDAFSVDDDQDDVADDVDNCPGLANADQSDDDRDDIGNACDNCPLIGNNAQRTDGDADPVGDACDPHPASDGDCLVLFDSFTDPAFDTYWQRLPGSGTATVSLVAGTIEIVPATGSIVGFAAPVGDAAADVILRARRATTGHVAAIAHATSPTASYSCGVAQQFTKDQAYLSAGSLSYYRTAPLSSAPLRDELAIRLTSERAVDRVGVITCRVDHGVAVAADYLGPPGPTLPAVAPGNPGFFVKDEAAQIEAIAVYRYAPGMACPVPVLR